MIPSLQCERANAIRCLRKKQPLRNFDAKAFFEAWSTASDVVFRAESEFKVKNTPKLPKKQEFCKIRKNRQIRNFGNFEKFNKKQHFENSRRGCFFFSQTPV